MLLVQSNLANTYDMLGREEDALRLRRDIHSGWLKLYGEEHEMTLFSANNLVLSLVALEHSKEVKSFLRRTLPVAQRVLGETNDTALKMRMMYAAALCNDTNATLDDIREAVTTFEETTRTSRRVFGSGHPIVVEFEEKIRVSREILRAREARA